MYVHIISLHYTSEILFYKSEITCTFVISRKRPIDLLSSYALCLCNFCICRSRAKPSKLISICFKEKDKAMLIRAVEMLLRSLSQYRTFAEKSALYLLNHKSLLSLFGVSFHTLDNFWRILRRQTPTLRRLIEKFSEFSNSDAMLLSKMCYPLAKRSRNTYRTFQHRKQFCITPVTAHPFVVMDTDVMFE